MYVSYEVWTNTKTPDYGVVWMFEGIYPWLPWHKAKPSDCVFMVPGTVDPMED